MTENEIIDFLEDEINGLKAQTYGELGEIAAKVFKEINGDERIKVFRVAISALEEIQQYREIGTVEECRKAVEKQKPKKPLGGADINGNEYMICRECSAIVEDGEWRAMYCPDCGQAIQWDENLEGMEDE